MFDEVATDEYLNRIVSICQSRNIEPSNRFTEEQSKDFYLGMIAAVRVLTSFIQEINGEDLMFFVSKLGIDAAIIANKKQ